MSSHAHHSSDTALPAAVQLGGADVTAVLPVREDIIALVRKYGSLYEWAAEQPQPMALRGRAPVYVAELPMSKVRAVVRHAWHGGLLAPITGDRFRHPSRAPIEMMYSEKLRAAGIPTTEVLGFIRYSAGPGMVRVDVVTRFLPNTTDLGMVLGGLSPDINCDEALAATAQLLDTLAANGVVHRDLNVKNILLQRENKQQLLALMIDVDVITWNRARSPVETMRRNVARLERSMLKWRRNFDCDLAEHRIAIFTRNARQSATTIKVGSAAEKLS